MQFCADVSAKNVFCVFGRALMENVCFASGAVSAHFAKLIGIAYVPQNGKKCNFVLMFLQIVYFVCFLLGWAGVLISR